MLLEEFKSDPQENFLESGDLVIRILNDTVACSSEVVSLIMRELSALWSGCIWNHLKLRKHSLTSSGSPEFTKSWLFAGGRAEPSWTDTELLRPCKSLPVGQCPGWCLESRKATFKRKTMALYSLPLLSNTSSFFLVSFLLVWVCSCPVWPGRDQSCAAIPTWQAVDYSHTVRVQRAMLC